MSDLLALYFLRVLGSRYLTGLAKYRPLYGAQESHRVVFSGWEGGGGCDAVLSVTEQSHTYCRKETSTETSS